jgi:hypothetical protein
MIVIYTYIVAKDRDIVEKIKMKIHNIKVGCDTGQSIFIYAL